ncbi:MAG: phosphotransferase [Egibacteraceae bacterium]
MRKPLNAAAHRMADPGLQRRVARGGRWLAHRDATSGWRRLSCGVRRATREVAGLLAEPPAGYGPVLVHRDSCDKQVTITDDGQVGPLDFDTLAVGEAALDIGNALAQLELRAMQGYCSPATGGCRRRPGRQPAAPVVRLRVSPTLARHGWRAFAPNPSLPAMAT